MYILNKPLPNIIPSPPSLDTLTVGPLLGSADHVTMLFVFVVIRGELLHGVTSLSQWGALSTWVE